MDIYDYLKRDHRKVSQLIKAVIKAENAGERKKLFLQIKKELELHADPEDKTFYQELKKNKTGKEDAEHAEKEHDIIKKLLTKISKTSSEEVATWLVYFGELKYVVEHHVKEEENEIFVDAKKIISAKRSRELAQEMEELKNKMQNTKKFKEKFELN